LSLVTALSPYPTAEHIQDVYWRTLVANTVVVEYPRPPSGFFDNFATYLELNRLYLPCENRHEVMKEALKRMTVDDIVRHHMFEEVLAHVENRVLFTPANGYASLGPHGLKKGDRILSYSWRSDAIYYQGK
jgi:hypothetical protein